jgi:hypothetical protein
MHRKLNIEDTVAIIVASVGFFLILSGTYLYHCIRRRKLAKSSPTNDKTDPANPFADHSVAPVTVRFSADQFIFPTDLS